MSRPSAFDAVENVRVVRRKSSFRALFLGSACLLAPVMGVVAEDTNADPAKQGETDAVSSDAVSSSLCKVFSNSRGAVVKIRGKDSHGELAGTGFFIDPNGTLYTAYSVGGSAAELTVEFGAKKYPARRLVADPRSGVAILKVEAEE